jgi:hypothetical protein
MKNAKAIVSIAVALVTFLAGLLSAAAAPPVPAAAVACFFVGRAFQNSSGQGEVVGYFTDITGISGPLFSGAPGEDTAFFTIRSDIVQLTPLPTNGDVGLALGSAGTFDIYFNPTPIGDWSNPDTFSSGQLIARFTRPEGLLLQIPTYSRAVLTGTLVSSRRFSLKGHEYDLRAIFPAGLTFDESFSNTGVPGVTNFPVGLAFAGDCLAVAGRDRDGQ